jgi:Zn/Cd-binding protein ZinT
MEVDERGDLANAASRRSHSKTAVRRSKAEKRKLDMQENIAKAVAGAFKMVDSASQNGSNNEGVSQSTESLLVAKADLTKATTLQVKSSTLLHMAESVFFKESTLVTDEERVSVERRLLDMMREAMV